MPKETTLSASDLILEAELIRSGNFVVRHNLLNQVNYTPYCGNKWSVGCSMPRTRWNGEQFVCPECGFTSEYPKVFIEYYKLKWNK